VSDGALNNSCSVSIAIIDVCGDGIKSGGEICDTLGNVGCSISSPKCDSCTSCKGIPGDGYVGAGEVCDTLGDVGCTSPNPECSGGTACVGLCGDGAIGTGETCDILGNVGCTPLAPNCKNDCSICSSCDINNGFKIMDKSVNCIVKDTTMTILNLVGGIALLILILSGILYMTSAGSPDSKSKAKKFFFAALVGLALVLISYAIVFVLDRLMAKV